MEEGSEQAIGTRRQDAYVDDEATRHDSGISTTATGEDEGPGPLAETAGGEKRAETKGDGETQTEPNTGEKRDEAIEIESGEGDGNGAKAQLGGKRKRSRSKGRIGRQKKNAA